MSLVANKGVDWKLDLLIKELKRYRVCVAGIRNIKRLGGMVRMFGQRLLVAHFSTQAGPCLERMLLPTGMKVLEFSLVMWLLRCGSRGRGVEGSEFKDCHGKTALGWTW